MSGTTRGHMSRRALLAASVGAPALLSARRGRAAEADGAVTIGVLSDLSSSYADVAGKGSIEATRMAIEDFGGAVLGKPVGLVFADGLNKPDVALSIARQWWDEAGVDAIADVPTSNIAFALMGLSAQKRKILLVSSAASSDISGKSCSPYTTQWTYDSYAMANCTGNALVDQGAKAWYFIAGDNAFGQSLVNDASAVVRARGGRILGVTKAAMGTADYSPFLLEAQSVKADIICLANGGLDMINALKQAAEFGIRERGERMAGLVVQETDVRSLGLQAAQGLVLTTAFYWDRNDASRVWSKRFLARVGHMPTMLQAGAYSQALHYLKAVQIAGTKDAEAVIHAMQATPVNDMFAHDGKVLPNGRMVHDMYLMEVKSPAESTGEWDIFKPLATVPGERAFRTAAASGCPATAL
jgi:branched-chain amino acid transport system substrate-binding protein